MSSRWHLPLPPLRRSVMLALCAALALAGLGAALARTWLSLSAPYFLKVAAVSLAVLGTAAGLAADHHRFPTFGPANLTTTFRVALVALLAGLLGEPHTSAIEWFVTTLTIVITVLDGIDGWLARRTGLDSPFGARFDMETDALLILVLAALAWRWDRAGVWVLACGLMRYAFVIAAAPWPWLERPLPPSVRRKAICVVQIVGLAIAIAPVVQPPLSAWLAATTLVVLSYSFLADVAWLYTRRVQ